jgi:hypothetical protein
MEIRLERISANLYCALERAHGILRELRFVPSMGNSLRSSIPGHIFARIRKRSYVLVST